MAALRSIQFYRGTPPVVGGVNTWTDVYTVPSGHIIIFKNAVMFNGGASAHSGAYRVDAAQIIRQTSVAVNATDNFSTWIVLEAGATLAVLQVVGATLNYFLSGSLLYL